MEPFCQGFYLLCIDFKDFGKLYIKEGVVRVEICEERMLLAVHSLAINQLLVEIVVTFDSSVRNSCTCNPALPVLDDVETFWDFSLFEDVVSIAIGPGLQVTSYRHEELSLNILK